jgi:hypothetical protein
MGTLKNYKPNKHLKKQSNLLKIKYESTANQLFVMSRMKYEAERNKVTCQDVL